jgi:Zn-dependent protease with chaperone function
MPSMSAGCEVVALTGSDADVFYDGATGARHRVSVEFDPAALLVRAAEGHLLARWPYDELRKLVAPEGILRLARIGNPLLARLEIRNPAIAAALGELSPTIDHTGARERIMRRMVVVWTVAAMVSLVLVGYFGMPALADRLAPLVPLSVETKLGNAVDTRVRAMLDTGRGQSFECGLAESEKVGRAAFDRLVGRLEAAAALPVPLRVVVVRRSQPNAFVLPGGRIYVFEGLIAKSESADELAAVIAHEIGHLAHRDGTRSVLQAAGLSFLFGILLGDFVGGGVVVIAARQVLQSAYARDVEASADLYGVGLMARVGGDPRALGAILTRISGANHPGMKILLDHPETRDRVAAITAATTPKSGPPLIEPSEWTALKRVCAGR